MFTLEESKLLVQLIRYAKWIAVLLLVGLLVYCVKSGGF